MIRQAIFADVPTIVEQGLQFLNTHPIPIRLALEPQPAELEAIIRSMIELDACVLLAEHDGKIVAGLLGAVTPLMFQPYVRVAAELAWWVHPEHRGGSHAFKLVRAFEAWGAAQDVAAFVFSDIVADSTPNVGQMLGRIGYELTEQSHFKVNSSKVNQCQSQHPQHS